MPGRRPGGADRAAGPARPSCSGLPRGGVPVAVPIAERWHLPLAVLAVRKLGAPGRPELAMGAVAAIGDRVELFRNESIVRQLGVDEERFGRIRDREVAELADRVARFGATPELRDQHVIVVDDGLATGATMLAAVQVVATTEPASITVAVPGRGPPGGRRALAARRGDLPADSRPVRRRRAGVRRLPAGQRRGGRSGSSAAADHRAPNLRRPVTSWAVQSASLQMCVATTLQPASFPLGCRFPPCGGRRSSGARFLLRQPPRGAKRLRLPAELLLAVGVVSRPCAELSQHVVGVGLGGPVVRALGEIELRREVR